MVLTLFWSALTCASFFDWNRLRPPNFNLALNKDENPKYQDKNKGEAKDDIHSRLNFADYICFSLVVNREKG